MKQLTVSSGAMKRLTFSFVCGALLSLSGCSRVSESRLTEERAQEAQAEEKKPSPAATEERKAAPAGAGEAQHKEGAADAGEQAYRYQTSGRLVAIGDLHGDFEATRAVFRLVGATDAADRWVGGTLTIVQTGDQLDRGDGERLILEFLERLAGEASAAGGRLIVLNGNHETMNALGDFRYVTAGALSAFDGSEESPLAQVFPSQLRGRAGAFLPGGAWAKKLAERPVIVQVNDVLFAHAGVRAPHVDYGIDRLNRETAAWLRGELRHPPRLITDEEGPLWTRVYGNPRLDDEACSVLTRALERAKARRMVVGHTVQQGGVSAACDERVYRIDVGLSAYYGGRSIQALEILSNGARVLTTPR
jgi:hypothetical protein